MKPENVKCPECQGPMTPRTNKSNGTKFWGCLKFPKCKGTRDSMGMSKEDRENIDNGNDDEDPIRWDRRYQ